MSVVTISRLYGIGGRTFGRSLAERLGWDYVDKELLSGLSEKLGRGESQVSFYEDMGRGPSSSLLAMLARKYPAASDDVPAAGEYADALADVLREVAGRGRAVIVGRGGQAVLADFPGALHLRLIADDPFLVSRLVAEGGAEGFTERELLKKVRHQCEVREDFVRRHFDVDWADPLNYHFVINLGRLPIHEAEDLVVGLVQRREAEETSPPSRD
jgi:hypothetical protein